MNHCMLGMSTTRSTRARPAKAPTSIACQRSSQNERPTTITSTPWAPPASRLAGWSGPECAGSSSEEPKTSAGLEPAAWRHAYERSSRPKSTTSDRLGYPSTGSRSTSVRSPASDAPAPPATSTAATARTATRFAAIYLPPPIRARRSILPLPVTGSAERNSIFFGTM